MSVYKITTSKKHSDLLNNSLTTIKTLYKNYQYFCTTRFTNVVNSIKFAYERFEHVAFIDVTFTDCTFECITFTKCAFMNCRFINCKFNSVDFTHSLSKVCQFDNCEFSNCIFLEIYVSASSGVIETSQFDIEHSRIYNSRFNNWHITSYNKDKLVNFGYVIFDDTDVNFTAAQMKNIVISPYSFGYYKTCPETGAYIAYKYARVSTRSTHKKPVIVKLQILENAKRSSANGRKCRASAAKVLSISSIDQKTYYKKAFSDWTNSFIYEVGKIVQVENFDNYRWEECSTGIHHFLTRQEAVTYALM